MISRIAVALGSFALTVLALEGCLRVALFSEWFAIEALRNPGLYAEYNADDGYWKLQLRWSKFSGLPRGWWHPLLGRLPPRTKENPLGLLRPHTRFPLSDPSAPVVLFYGDSYLANPPQPSGRIPALLEDRLEGIPVLSFGMGGYGLDQIVLRFETTHDRFRNPQILIGIFTGDVDRCILTVRACQKPRFVLRQDGTLVLTNVPIEKDQLAYLRDNPPQI